ncbi:MAG: glutamine amidotransferase [Oscillospiraceae bacterium]|nr:glutamine amidotransferase [Oscillospiraceae bacterium]MDD4368807.1 glutamine amidotransferase [Oscillospiraceae bacterium]
MERSNEPQGLKQLKLCHLYPDLLNLYGDIGNIIALTQRARVLGVSLERQAVSMGTVLDPEAFDIFFIGGGQDAQQTAIQGDLLKNKQGLCQAARQGKVILAVCGGYQLLGEKVGLANGSQMEGLGILDVRTESGSGRLIGDTVYQADFLQPDLDGPAVGPTDRRLLFGFENHGSRTYLQGRARPLAKVLYGYGNNGQDGTEGACWEQVYGTYSHGSFLPKNPAMTDYLIRQAYQTRYGCTLDLPAPDRLEIQYESQARAQAWQRVAAQLEHHKAGGPV